MTNITQRHFDALEQSAAFFMTYSIGLHPNVARELWQRSEALRQFPTLIRELQAESEALRKGQKLDKPARVGNTTFHAGIKWRIVIEAAQRQHEYATAPEHAWSRDPERIKSAGLQMADLQKEARKALRFENRQMVPANTEPHLYTSTPDHGDE